MESAHRYFRIGAPLILEWTHQSTGICTESAERVGIIEKVMNDGSIGSTFNEGYMKVEGETAYCVDINTNFKNGYKTSEYSVASEPLNPLQRAIHSER